MRHVIALIMVFTLSIVPCSLGASFGPDLDREGNASPRDIETQSGHQLFMANEGFLEGANHTKLFGKNRSTTLWDDDRRKDCYELSLRIMAQLPVAAHAVEGSRTVQALLHQLGLSAEQIGRVSNAVNALHTNYVGGTLWYGEIQNNISKTLRNLNPKSVGGVKIPCTNLKYLGKAMSRVAAITKIADFAFGAAVQEALAGDLALGRLNLIEEILRGRQQAGEAMDPAIFEAVAKARYSLERSEDYYGALMIELSDRKDELVQIGVSAGVKKIVADAVPLLKNFYIKHAAMGSKAAATQATTVASLWGFSFLATYATIDALLDQHKMIQIGITSATLAHFLEEELKEGRAIDDHILKALVLQAKYSYFDQVGRAASGILPGFYDLISKGRPYREVRDYYNRYRDQCGQQLLDVLGAAYEGELPPEVLVQPRGQNITTDQARELLPYAELALAVYGDDAPPVGWRRIVPKMNFLEKISKTTAVSEMVTGFHATTCQGPGGELVVAFEGTKPLSPADWVNNLGQLITIPPQYEMAVDYVRKIKNQTGVSNITLTGHSLGGGLAQYAGGMLGLKTITFNHAGLWASTYFDVAAHGQSSSAEITHVVTQGYVFKKNLFVQSKQDPVSRWGIYLGDIVRVPMESPGWIEGYFYRHGMENLRNAIMAIAKVPSTLAAVQTIIAIVDSSGSMSSTDPKSLRKAALRMMIDTLDTSTALGLVDFDSNARLLTAPLQLGAFNGSDRLRLKQMVDTIDSNGGTDIAAGLVTAAGQIPRDGSQVTLVLLTDGQDSHWKGEGDMLPTGVAVHTIALSDKADREGLGKLSAATGGIAEIASNADDLKRIIGNLFGEATGQEVLLVKTGTINQGDDIFYEVYVDSGVPYVTFQADWRGSDVDLVLTDPTGWRFDTASAVQAGFGIEASNYDIVRLDNPVPGRWEVHLVGTQLPIGGEPYTFRVSSSDGKVKTRWKMSMPVAEVGTPVSIDLATQGDVQWQQAQVETWLPDGSHQARSDPLGGLLTALGGESGVSVFNFIPSQTGVHQVRITVQGRMSGGETVQRSFDRTLRVAPPGRGQRYKMQIDPFIRRVPGMLR